MQVEVDLIAIAHQKRMEAIANRHCRLNNATSVVRHIFGNRRAFAFLGNALQKRYFRNNIDWPLSHFLSCKLQPSGDLFFYQNKRIFLNKPNIIKEKFGPPRKFLKRTQTAKRVSVCVAKPLLLAIKCCATATFLVMWGCCCQSGLFGAHWN